MFLSVDFVLVCLTIVLTIIYYSRKLKKNYSLFEELKIPGPSPKWIFGNIQDFRDKNPFDVFKLWRKQYGNIYGYFEGFRPSIVVNDPEMAKNILVKYFDKFHARPIHNPFSYYPDNHSLLNTSGSIWKQQRAIVAKAFNMASMEHIAACINETSSELLRVLNTHVEKFSDGFDISGVVDRFTLDAFAYSGFNYKVNSLKDENALLFQFMKAFNHSAAADNPIAGLARVYESLTPFLQIFDRRHKELHEQHLEKVRLVIKEERAKVNGERDRERDIAEGKGIEGNLLHQLISRSFNDRDEKGVLIQRYLNDEDIVGHLNALIGGGLGTTNAALAFVIHYLAIRQDIQEKLYSEITEKCEHKENPDVDAVRNMEYLDMVLEETLRLTPVAPGTARMCTDDCEINGVHFKKDMFVRIMCVTLYDDEEYFPHPDKFIPERFLKNESSKRNPFTFLPYGQGPRMCPGIKYAHLLVKIALVKILQRYRIDRCSKTIDPLPTALRPMLVPKDGVYVQLKRRF